MIRPVDGTVRSELNLAFTDSGITTGTQRHRRRSGVRAPCHPRGGAGEKMHHDFTCGAHRQVIVQVWASKCRQRF